jgi:hypothetical protein
VSFVKEIAVIVVRTADIGSCFSCLHSPRSIPVVEDTVGASAQLRPGAFTQGPAFGGNSGQ